MASITLNDGTVIGDYNKPYYVAEVNSSHNGSVDIAKDMVIKAKEIGCDCVKFQSWSAESLYSKTYYNNNPIAKRIVKKFALSRDEQKKISSFCKEYNISFASTPYSEEEVDFLLDECNVPYIKIASMDVITIPFLQYIAKKNTAIVLATGMADGEEIKRAVDTILDAGNERLCMLHCISIYPSKPEMMQINNIIGLRETFPYIPIGFSDHTKGYEIACASVALGSCMIEKHFTLDNKKMGMDNNMATEPEEFAALISCCNNVFDALGTTDRVISDAELEQRRKMRRSVIAARNLNEGDVINRSDLLLKRPGDGIPADKLDFLVGKTLLCDVEEDTIINYGDIK